MIEPAEHEHDESPSQCRERIRSGRKLQTKRLDGNKTGPEQQQTPQSPRDTKRRAHHEHLPPETTDASRLATTLSYLKNQTPARRSPSCATYEWPLKTASGPSPPKLRTGMKTASSLKRLKVENQFLDWRPRAVHFKQTPERQAEGDPEHPRAPPRALWDNCTQRAPTSSLNSRCRKK